MSDGTLRERTGIRGRTRIAADIRARTKIPAYANTRKTPVD
ncbi:hypothetical protein ABZZ47_19820 [Streptomyces sp. NPDC006465]